MSTVKGLNDDDAAAGPDAFETSLRNYLDSPEGKKQRVKARLLLRVLDSPPSKKRTRFLDRFKAHVGLHLFHEGMTATADPVGIDWSSIDWQKVFDAVMQILKLILALLPLFM